MMQNYLKNSKCIYNDSIAISNFISELGYSSFTVEIFNRNLLITLLPSIFFIIQNIIYS